MPEKKKSPSNSKANSALLQDMVDKFNASLEHPAWQAFSKNAPKDFNYRQGEQWTAADRKVLEDRGQAATTENEITPIIDRLIGRHKQQKTRIIYRGRNVGSDEKKSNILTDLALHIHQRSDYEFEEGDCFENGNTCGFGVMEVKIAFDEALQPEVLIENTESLDIFPDPQSKKYDWNKDSDFITRAKWMPVKKAQALYPSFKRQIKALTSEENQGLWDDREDVKQDNYVDVKNQRVRVMETWWKKYTIRKMAFVNGKVKDVTDVKKPEGRVLTQIRPEMQKTLWLFEIIIENGESPYNHNMFPFAPYFVYRKKNGEPYSKVRQLIDPQDEINKRRSKALHLLSTNQAVMEEGAVQNDDTLKMEMAKPDGIIKYRRGFQFALEKNIEVAQTQMSFQQESKAAIPRIAGVSDEALGRKSELRSGIALQRKQLMTEILVNPIFDNLRRTRKIVGKLQYELIKQYYTEEKEFLVTDELGEDKQFNLDKAGIKEIQEGIYDIIIQEAPDTATIQDEQFQLIASTVQGLGLPPAVNLAMLPMLFEASQLRSKDAIVQKLNDLASAPPQEIPQMSLNLSWDKLTNFEKSAFAKLMGQGELAQAELQAGVDGDPNEQEAELG